MIAAEDCQRRRKWKSQGARSVAKPHRTIVQKRQTFQSKSQHYLRGPAIGELFKTPFPIAAVLPMALSGLLWFAGVCVCVGGFMLEHREVYCFCFCFFYLFIINFYSK